MSKTLDVERRLAERVGPLREPLFTATPVFPEGPESFQEVVERLRADSRRATLEAIFGELDTAYFGFNGLDSYSLRNLNPYDLGALLRKRDFLLLTGVAGSDFQDGHSELYDDILRALAVHRKVSWSDLNPKPSRLRRPGIVVTTEARVHFGHLQFEKREGNSSQWVLATKNGAQTVSRATFVKPRERV